MTGEPRVTPRQTVTGRQFSLTWMPFCPLRLRCLPSSVPGVTQPVCSSTVSSPSEGVHVHTCSSLFVIVWILLEITTLQRVRINMQYR